MTTSPKARAALGRLRFMFLMLVAASVVPACYFDDDGIAHTTDPEYTDVLRFLGFPATTNYPRRIAPTPRLPRFRNSARSSVPAIAPFFGNVSAVTLPASAAQNDYFVMAREDDCSLTFLEYHAVLNAGMTAVLVSPDLQLPHYETRIHDNAFLGTTPDSFPHGCVDNPNGNTSRLIAALGEAKNESEVVATVGPAGIFYSSVTAAGSFTGPFMLATEQPPLTVIGADLNKDGNPDGVSVNTDGLTSSITVFLGNDDATLATRVNLALPGSAAAYAIIDDVNGDGILDIVASSSGPTFAFSVFIGNGDGTFKQAQTVAPAGNLLGFSTAFITADVNKDGKKDIIAANGQVFLGAGDGVTYTLKGQIPLSGMVADLTGFAPQIVAADFDGDGKLDLATDDGATIRVYLGWGDGTFRVGPAYATIADFGFMIATDLDGDGNLDLWVGLGGNYGYAGASVGLGYALMGNGDGTFQGAPNMPSPYNGGNLLDLNADGRPDFVALANGNGQSTLTTFVTNPAGIPVATSEDVVTTGVDSYALGDVNGDTIPDLVFVTPAPQAQSFEVQLGKGDGSFVGLTGTPVPSLVPSGLDANPAITGLQLADINHDGKLDLVYNFIDQDGAPPFPYIEGFVIQLGNGNGTFQAPVITKTYDSTTAPEFAFMNMLSAVADVNGDNFPDVIMVLPTSIVDGTAQHQAELFLGNGDGTFKAGSPLALTANIIASDPGGSGSPFVIADVNGDHKLDLVAGGSTADGTTPEVAIALGNGNGTFQTPTLLKIEGFGFVYSLAVGDFDGDSKLDLFVGGDGSGIFPGNGDGSFQTLANPDGSVSPPGHRARCRRQRDRRGSRSRRAARPRRGQRDSSQQARVARRAHAGADQRRRGSVTEPVDRGRRGDLDGDRDLGERGDDHRQRAILREHHLAGHGDRQRRRGRHVDHVCARARPERDHRAIRGRRELRRQYVAGDRRDGQPGDRGGDRDDAAVVAQPGTARGERDLHGDRDLGDRGDDHRHGDISRRRDLARHGQPRQRRRRDPGDHDARRGYALDHGRLQRRRQLRRQHVNRALGADPAGDHAHLPRRGGAGEPHHRAGRADRDRHGHRDSGERFRRGRAAFGPRLAGGRDGELRSALGDTGGRPGDRDAHARRAHFRPDAWPAGAGRPRHPAGNGRTSRTRRDGGPRSRAPSPRAPTTRQSRGARSARVGARARRLHDPRRVHRVLEQPRVPGCVAGWLARCLDRRLDLDDGQCDRARHERRWPGHHSDADLDRPPVEYLVDRARTLPPGARPRSVRALRPVRCSPSPPS